MATDNNLGIEALYQAARKQVVDMVRAEQKRSAGGMKISGVVAGVWVVLVAIGFLQASGTLIAISFIGLALMIAVFFSFRADYRAFGGIIDSMEKEK